MDQRDPSLDDATDLYAAQREQQDLEILREGQFESTYIDASREGPLLSEDEFLDESGD